MKIIVRTLALSLVLAGIVTGTLPKKALASAAQAEPTTSQVDPASAPMPVCPFNSGDCGISKF